MSIPVRLPLNGDLFMLKHILKEFRSSQMSMLIVSQLATLPYRIASVLFITLSKNAVYWLFRACSYPSSSRYLMDG
ncbi:MAG: hypothetical protein QM669_11650 [Siphonobacter sp.]